MNCFERSALLPLWASAQNNHCTGLHKKKLKNKANVCSRCNSFGSTPVNPVPLACKLFAHHAFRSSGIRQNTVLASDLAAFYDFLKSEV
jgi:hypothetical protein